ncbi:MAG: hypothetical protein IJR99_00540 [Kiritimatiellae bacterium]|nr:hypothetical protein [Kiritimatiellia bacterium]
MTDEEKIIERILNVIPPRSFELMTFLSLFRVRFSNKTETACVTCGDSPELLLNQEFIGCHCKTDEHLFMLVMHELYHVILGHTRLFPRSTEVRNLVFDAVINALLCSLFPRPEFTSFFTEYYPPDKMPYTLLRPKGRGTPPEAENALRLLYGGSDIGTYYDVYEALLKSGCVQEISLLLSGEGHAGHSPQPGNENDGRGDRPVRPHGDKPLLLGSHGEEDEEMSAEMKDLIHKIISKWPSPDRPLKGRDLGSSERERDFDAKADPNLVIRRGIRRLMRRAAMPGQNEVRCRSVRERLCETATFLPDWRDRSHEAREAALGDALVYRAVTMVCRPSSRDNRQAFVYFDVSGSVAVEVPSVAQALLPYCRRGLCTVHVFSTVVYPTTARDLAARKFFSTGGTNIDCVLRHVLDLPARKRPRSVVVVTDGYTGCPKAALVAGFRSAGMRLYVGLVKSDPQYNPEKDLSSISNEFVRLF